MSRGERASDFSVAAWRLRLCLCTTGVPITCRPRKLWIGPASCSCLAKYHRRVQAAEGVEHVDLGDVVREKITYAVEPGERVPALVLLPKKGSGRLPAILCHH